MRLFKRKQFIVGKLVSIQLLDRTDPHEIIQGGLSQTLKALKALIEASEVRTLGNVLRTIQMSYASKVLKVFC